MSSSRARTRFAAVFAAVPVLMAGGPLVSPALASTQYGVTNLMADGQVVGPNTGYLGFGTGQAGSTAMFKVAPPSSSATISSLEVTLSDIDNPGTYVYQAELDPTDGLALYADVNDNGVFDAADKATGLRSNGYRTGRVQPGEVPFILTFNQPVSGSSAYFVAIHPSTGALNGRRFTFRIDAGDIAGSGGTGPVTGATTPARTANADPRIQVDSVAPVTPARTFFTSNPKQPGTEDEYQIGPGVVGSDTGVKVAFFKAADNLAPAALLTRPGFDPAKPVTDQLGAVALADAVNPANAAQAQVVKIGDGSGIFPDANPKVLVAKNNQDSNAVYARFIDPAGNVSGVVELSDCFVAPGTTACETPRRGNPVVAPPAPESTFINSTPAAINAANQAAVPVVVNAPPANTTLPTTRADADARGVVEKAVVRIAQKTPAGAYDTVYTTAKYEKAYDAAAGSVEWTSDDAIDTRLSTDPNKTTEKGIQEGNGLAFVVAVHTDRAGNPSSPVESVAYAKDIVAPTVVIEASKSPLAKGDTVGVRFSEPMRKDDIGVTGAPVAGVCPDRTDGIAVEHVLDVRSATGTADDRAWGTGNCFTWNTDSVGTITLGTKRVESTNVQELAEVGNRVLFGTIRDAAGNQTVGLTTAGETTVVLPSGAPIPITAGTKDADRSGQLDGIEVSFTTALEPGSVEQNLARFQVMGGTTVPVTRVSSVGGDAKKLLFEFNNQFGTGERPELRLVAGPNGTTGVIDTAGNPVDPFSVVAADTAAPQPINAKTVDSNRDGMIDDVVVTYSELIEAEKDNNPAESNGVVVNTNKAAYHVAGYAPPAPTTPPGPTTEGRNPATPKTGKIATRTLALTRPATPTVDTNATPLVKFTSFTSATNEVFAPKDASGNTWTAASGTSYTIVAEDGAAPAYVSRITRDLDSDGRVDAIDVKLTEPISTLSLAASFTVTGHQVLDQYGLAQDEIRIVIDETAPATGDTGAASTPTIKHNGGITDVRGNAMLADANPLATTDGAPPAIAAACPGSPTGRNGLCPADDPNLPTDDGTKMNVFFSEPLTAGSVAKEDFVVEQPAGEANKKTIESVLVTNSADNKYSTVTLTFAQNTLSATADSVVRLAAAGAVADAGNVVSTQVASVPAFAPPTVSLNLTCPTASKPGYCMANTINTGATGSNAITRWRLSETARATVPPDGEFKAGLPAVYPESGVLPEGDLVLYFSGKDELGRLSPEVDGIITILKPPTIGQVQYLNTTSRASNKFSKTTTVLDGDALKIAANAYGTDAEQWAEDGQPTGGGCLKANMAIDVRSLSGISSQSAVAPFSCNLEDTTPPHRQMQFPVVTAQRTTRFPVGTAIKSSAGDPGSLIVDGASGLVRRPFISVNARRSWMIPDAAVITVPLKAYTGIPSSTKRVGFRDGAVLRSASGTYYYVENGVKRPVAASRLAYWKISTARAYAVTSTELSRMPSGTPIGGSRHAVGTWIKYSNGAIYQIVKNSRGAIVRRKLASTSALRTRVPSTQVYPANRYDSVPIDSWLIGYRDGTLLKFSDGTYGVIARGSLRKFENPLTFNSLGFNNSHALNVNSLAMPRVSGQAFRTGSVIDRYKLGAVTIKVTNNAGAVVTAQVPNSSGLYGVGTLDPRPAGWDMTR